MSTEAKVGAFTLLGIVLMAGIFIHLSGFKWGGDKSYQVYVTFSQVMGLNPDADVRFAGVPAGKVKSIVPEGNGVRVELAIKPEIKIPRKSKITISMNGFMGEKFINIQPPAEKSSDFLQPGDYVIGLDEQNMATMMENANKAIVEVQQLLQSINDVLGNPQVKSSMVAISLNMRDVTENLKNMTAALSRMAVDNEGDIRQSVQKLNAMMTSLMQASDQVNRMVQSFSGNGQTVENLKISIANITSASESVRKMASNMESTVGDPQTAAELKQIIHNASQVSERMNKASAKLGNIKVEPGLETMYSGKAGNWTTNFGLDIYTDPNSFLTLGIDDLGEGNKVNAQAGWRQGSFAGRAGMVDSKPGIGIDAYAGAKWKFSADAYNLNDASLKLRAQYQIAPHTYLVGQVNDMNRSDDRTAYFGLRHTF